MTSLNCGQGVLVSQVLRQVQAASRTMATELIHVSTGMSTSPNWLLNSGEEPRSRPTTARRDTRRRPTPGPVLRQALHEGGPGTDDGELRHGGRGWAGGAWTGPGLTL